MELTYRVFRQYLDMFVVVLIDDIDLFVETIPYAETRLYVKTVTRNRHEYRRIYERDGGTEQPGSETQ